MAAGTLKSTQETNRTAVPPVMNASNTRGRVHRAYFNYTVAGTALDAGTTIDLVRLPAGARLSDGYVYVDGGFAGAGVTLDIGDAGDAARLASALDVSAEAFTHFPDDAATAAKCVGYELTADTTIIATTAVDVIVAAGVIKGWVDYVLE